MRPSQPAVVLPSFSDSHRNRKGDISVWEQCNSTFSCSKLEISWCCIDGWGVCSSDYGCIDPPVGRSPTNRACPPFFLVTSAQADRYRLFALFSVVTTGTFHHNPQPARLLRASVSNGQKRVSLGAGAGKLDVVSPNWKLVGAVYCNMATFTLRCGNHNKQSLSCRSNGNPRETEKAIFRYLGVGTV